MKLYIVTGDMQKDCMIYNQIFYTYANNAKEACQLARDTWAAKNWSHLFHIHANKSTKQDIGTCTVRNWKNETIAGKALIGKFICTDFHAWRVNGRNLYGV